MQEGCVTFNNVVDRFGEICRVHEFVPKGESL